MFQKLTGVIVVRLKTVFDCWHRFVEIGQLNSKTLSSEGLRESGTFRRANRRPRVGPLGYQTFYHI
jgi:hypothetical protein